MSRVAILVVSAVGWLMIAPMALANQEVPEGYQQVAARHGIPAALFYSLALAESGQHIESLGVIRPWPWSLNIEGEGRFYASRSSAESAFLSALAQGRTSVDIGLMQVNWRYHGQALGPAHQALDPFHNLQVAAKILADCNRSRKDWWAAVDCYHAPNNPPRARRYQERVHKIWTRLTASGAH